MDHAIRRHWVEHKDSKVFDLGIVFVDSGRLKRIETTLADVVRIPSPIVGRMAFKQKSDMPGLRWIKPRKP